MSQDSPNVFTLRKRFTFEAAHYLPDHDGKCRRLHGHSWVGWVEVGGDDLEETGPKRGMIVDYGDISGAIRTMVDTYLDHYCLNDTLDIPVTSSEAIARWIFHHILPSGLPLTAVTIEETCTSSCTYRPTARVDW